MHHAGSSGLRTPRAPWRRTWCRSNGHVAVPEELLDGADVVTALQKVGGEGMAEGVAAGTLVDAGRAGGTGHGSLHVRFMVVVPALGGLVLPPSGSGKDPLPAPVAGRS